MLAVAIIAITVCAQGPKRDRGESMYQMTSSNTVGEGNLWITAQGTGFIWANKSLDTTKANASQTPGYFPFGQVSSEIGVLPNASLLLSSRVFSYTRNGWFQFGNIGAGVKLTLPDNKELRFRGFGLEVSYLWNYPGDTFPSLAGYRTGTTGFAPEGYVVDGSSLQFKFVNDYDFIALYSWLPLKACVNLGMRIPFKKADYVFPQILFDAGALYSSIDYDFFLTYSLEAFNNFFGPQKITGLGPAGRVMEIAFSENPMYLTLGGRLRYPNGVTLMACVPFLVSTNSGSAMTQADLLKWNHDPSAFADEKARGINSAFDPWFAKWKIVAEITFPIMYRQTGSEMMRNFLLLKAQGTIKKLDIDEQLKMHTDTDSSGADVEEKKSRLEEIEKRREQMQKTE